MNQEFEIIKQLRPDEIARYIRATGWQKKDFPNGNLLVFQSPDDVVDDAGNPIILTFPRGNDFSDTEKRVRTAIELLASLKSTSVANVAKMIKNLCVDIFNQRIFSSSQITSLPLEIAPQVIKLLRDLIYYSACAEEEPSPFFEKGRKIGKDYTEKCRFGHTFHGSFGLSLEMPLPPYVPSVSLPGMAAPQAPPIERRIIERIVNGLRLSILGVNEGDVTILTRNYARAFNANLCEKMGEITELLPDFHLGYSINWSPEYRVEADMNINAEMVIEPSVYRQFFESAAKSLRASRESEFMEITGEIVQLKAERADDDEDDSGLTAREIVISWEPDNGAARKIHVVLSKEDYARACDAHKDGKTVRINGTPEKNKKFFQLMNPASFMVLDDNGAE